MGGAESGLLLGGPNRSASSRVIVPSATSVSIELVAHGRLLRDLLGHEGLRERSLVPLVVAMPAVADEVDDDVMAEAPAECEREPNRPDRGLRVVGVDVDDRDVEALGEVVE